MPGGTLEGCNKIMRVFEIMHSQLSKLIAFVTDPDTITQIR